MFDKLIESNCEEAEFKPRRKFFMVSSFVVGAMFFSAVLFSLYAQNIDLGTDNFELAELLAPIATDAPEPVQPKQQPQQRNETQQSDTAVRRELIARITDTPKVPDKISTTRFAGLTRPDGPVKIDPFGAESNAYNPTGRSEFSGGDSSSDGETKVVAETEKMPPPPAAVKTAPKPAIIKSEGVINGKATYLPPPPYPAPAKTVGAFGVVNVQVTIDETGKVISSKALSGHALLRPSAESAAWKAKFSPTLLSKVPVKVTGVIMYNFKKN